MKQPVYNLTAKKVGNVELKTEVFKNKINHDLIYQVMVALASNKRRVIAHTKDRSDVRGGGRKPWKQKGTGRARAGSIRSPIFRGGGVTFGPTNERNFKRKINKKAKRKAFVCVLSGKLLDKELYVFDSFKVKKPSTKIFQKLIVKLKNENKSILIVTGGKDQTLRLSINNLNRVRTAMVANLSVLDLLKYKFLYLDKASIQYLNDKFSKTGVAVKKVKGKTKSGVKAKLKTDK